jgi:hypothetical protein
VKRTLFSELPGIVTGIALLFLSTNFLCAQTRTLRIAAYNIEADIDGMTAPLPGLIAPTNNPSDVAVGGTVEGIGEEISGGDAGQPLDILALEETTSNPTTVSPIDNALNTFYNSPGAYTNSTYQAYLGSANDGDGPNALVYNTHTVQLLASVPVDPSGGTSKLGSASGEYREVMRYEFAPAGVAPAPANEFYVYVSHYKSSASGSDATDQFYRQEEAAIIRTNEAIDLPATARILYVGDYNVDDSGEAGYQTILSNTAPNRVQQGGGIDPLNPTNNMNIDWSDSTTDTNILNMLTEHGYALEYRDDLQVMTTNIYFGFPGGLKYIPGSCHAFANNGSVAYGGSVASGADTALNNRLVTNGPVFLNATTIYQDLTGASDHLPVVADYTIPLPVPTIKGVNIAGTNLSFNVANCITGQVYTVLMATNLLRLANWVPVVTNVSTGTNFTFTLTNGFNNSGSPQFYLLEMP